MSIDVPAASASPAAKAGPVKSDQHAAFTGEAATIDARPGGAWKAYDGKIDGDEGAELAAIRETEEEIGLGRHFIDVIGPMPQIPVMSGFRITPVLATVRPGFLLKPNPDEVEHVFKVPLSFLMDPLNHEQGEWERGGEIRRFYVMPYEGWRIWGITAGIIRSVYERLYE